MHLFNWIALFFFLFFVPFFCSLFHFFESIRASIVFTDWLCEWKERRRGEERRGSYQLMVNCGKVGVNVAGTFFLSWPTNKNKCVIRLMEWRGGVNRLLRKRMVSRWNRNACFWEGETKKKAIQLIQLLRDALVLALNLDEKKIKNKNQ